MLKSLWNGLCSVFAPVFEGVFQHTSNIFTFVTDTILSVLDIFIGLFSGNWEQCWNGIKGIFTGIWDFVVNQFSNILIVICCYQIGSAQIAVHFIELIVYHICNDLLTTIPYMMYCFIIYCFLSSQTIYVVRITYTVSSPVNTIS